MSKFLQATNLTWSDSTATSVFQNCSVIHCEDVLLIRKMKVILNDCIVSYVQHPYYVSLRIVMFVTISA